MPLILSAQIQERNYKHEDNCPAPTLKLTVACPAIAKYDPIKAVWVIFNEMRRAAGHQPISPEQFIRDFNTWTVYKDEPVKTEQPKQ